MYSNVQRRFPGTASVIEALANTNLDFASLLHDYEELSTWLAMQQRLENTNDEEIGKARELIGELDNEIRQQLEKYDEHTR